MMNGIHDPDPHAETWELLPWLANGTLTGEELERVQAHLRQCAACRGRLEWERSLRAAGQPEPPLSARHAYAGLLPRLGPQEAKAGNAGLRGRWAGLVAANDPRWLRMLAAVQLSVICVLALVLAQVHAIRGGGQDRYRTLAAHPEVQGDIVVSFDPATPERELRRILQASGARVVDGPTASDAYVLAAEPGAAGSALRRLRAEPAVTLAEPLDAAAGGRQ
jgi:hypothetical protein